MESFTCGNIAWGTNIENTDVDRRTFSKSIDLSSEALEGKTGY